MQACDQTCAWCARDFWRWLRSREHQMRVPRKGESSTFAAEAATSVRPAHIVFVEERSQRERVDHLVSDADVGSSHGKT